MSAQLPYQCDECGARYYGEQASDACCEAEEPPRATELDTSSHLVRGQLMIRGDGPNEWVAGPDWVALWEVQ